VNFESPFTRHLPSTNRWVQLASSIPWDDIVGVYRTRLNNFSTGASNINPRVAIGALMVKHLLNISDREKIIAIQENIFIQHFIGFDSMVYEEPFNTSLFVEIRKRLGMEHVEQINDMIYKHSQKKSIHLKESFKQNDITDRDVDSKDESASIVETEDTKSKIEAESPITHSGKLLIDATACPQDIAYPTDLKLLNASREKSEEIIDKLYDPTLHVFKKPRTYREEARKRYLLVSKKKVRRRSEVRKAVGQQLRYLRRNLSSIDKLMQGYETTPLSARDAKYLDTIRRVYNQQLEMYRKRVHSVETG
jgi:IS5 family transposase